MKPTIKDIGAMLELLYGAYMRNKPDTLTMKMQVRVWHEYLNDYDVEIIKQAFDFEITHNKYLPTIADITNRIRKITIPSGLELWNLLEESAKQGSKTFAKLDKSSGEYVLQPTTFKEQFEKLPQVLKEYVKTPAGLKHFWEKEHNSFEKQQFMKDVEEIQNKLEVSHKLVIEGE